MPSKSTIEHYERVLETPIAEAECIIDNAEQEVRASSVRHPDAGDQAAAEYERQASTFKASAARQALRSLKQALERIRQGTFGECLQCGSDIEHGLVGTGPRQQWNSTDSESTTTNKWFQRFPEHFGGHKWADLGRPFVTKFVTKF